MTWELFLCLKKRFVHDVSQPRKVGGAFETRWIYFLIILFFGVCATGDLMYSWSLPAWRELIMDKYPAPHFFTLTATSMLSLSSAKQSKANHHVSTITPPRLVAFLTHPLRSHGLLPRFLRFQDP